ncbi:alpha/beta hydrolase [Haloarcula sp. S1AR25-5A]|uniref:Alpha/beta hydrolase n=1 Tax=Haloarcula terrestris TaxID=2950533 RepID=A0AAE4F3M2_9EURY|nr:alpha/beta hydrolase [Haloarcula terrestris]MDS0223843.1 alpha/beta hydrolase [Haloarcula terrestris]
MPPESQPSNPAVHTVQSSDGTSIAYESEGNGQPLILLHGGSGTRRAWDTLRPYLVNEFSLYVPDRRGRGDSSDGDDYSLAREAADLRALVDAVGETPVVFGHSFGGLVALTAAPEIAIDRLVLYEPPVLVDEHSDDDLAARMEARLEAGQRQAAMRLFIEENGSVSDVSQLPWWPEEANLHLTETVIRENYEVEAFDISDVPGIDIPVVLLTGEQSPDHLRAGVTALDDHLDRSHLIEMENVGHVATETAPEKLASLIKSRT